MRGPPAAGLATLLGLRNLARHPVRSGMAILGLAVTSALLLDMILLAGGLERSFERLLLTRGYQIRVAPAGTLPFDTEASVTGAADVLHRLRADPGVEAAAPIMGAPVHVRRGDSLLTLVAYGVDPRAQALYEVESGADLLPGDSTRVLLSAPAAALLGVGAGDTFTVVGGVDPQAAAPAFARPVRASGMARWLYDAPGQPSIGLELGVLQALARKPDQVSAIAVRVADDRAVPAVTDRLRAAFPSLAVNNIGDMVAQFRTRMAYFQQLSRILGTISLVVSVLLVSTLLTITVNERLGEIATLRAIGVRRSRVVAAIMVEGAALGLAGAGLGALLGAATVRYLDSILTAFPGLPAGVSFFVPNPGSLGLAAAVFLGSAVLAGVYPAFAAARAPIAATLHEEAA